MRNQSRYDVKLELQDRIFTGNVPGMVSPSTGRYTSMQWWRGSWSSKSTWSPLRICSSCGRAGRSPHARVSAGKIQQLHQWFLLRHRMPWKEKSFCWLWSTWPCLKEGTFLLHRYETWSRSQAYSRSWSSVGTGSHPQPLPSLSLCIWARVKCSVGHSWINMECLFMYKCTLKSCAAILSCYTEVSKTSGPVWSLWNDKNNNEESLIGFCESRMNYLLLCLWSAYWKKEEKPNLLNVFNQPKLNSLQKPGSRRFALHWLSHAHGQDPQGPQVSLGRSHPWQVLDRCWIDNLEPLCFDLNGVDLSSC